MRLVMVTPAIKTSAIGRMASLVTRALKKSGHQVVVVRSEDTSLLQAATHDFGVDLVPWTKSKQVARLARDADALIYQIGDNYAYHRGCLEWLDRAPGVICLHDFFLGHLFTGWAQDHKAEAVATLRTWYGDEAAKSFFRYRSSEEFIDATKDTAPMTEWISSLAYSVITHSNWGIQRVLDSCPGPVQVVPLAYDVPASSSEGFVNRKISTGQLNVLTVGHVNPNKRTESVIRAIGNSPVLRERTTYRLVGHIQPATAEHLSSLAKSLQVNLVISGEVDSEALAQAVRQSDVICCLRWPSLEAASASTIEAMLYGKPVVVTDTGFYSELADECVRKVRANNEIADLQAELEFLHENEHDRLALGARAAQWAAATFSPDNYAKKLVDASLASGRAAPMINACRSLTEILMQWGTSDSLLSLPDTLQPLQLLGHCKDSTPAGAQV